MGLQRESEVSLANGAAAIRLPMARERPCPMRRSLSARHGAWPLNRVILAGGDATGNAPAGAPCQDVWYYHTHLAIIANARSKALNFDIGMPLDAVLNRCNIDPSLTQERVNGFCELRQTASRCRGLRARF
jgi:hypothetical protein